MALPLAMAMVMAVRRRRRRDFNYRPRITEAMAVRRKSKETRRIRERKLNYRSMLERFILSSQSSSEDSKKSVCIIAKMWTKTNNTTYCFKFDPHQDDNGVGGGGELKNHHRRILSPNSGTCKINNMWWKDTCYAAIGSTMYWFGENNPPPDQSTDFPESGWKHGPPMIVPYTCEFHNKIVIDGKLYVFGGGGGGGKPWGECFDPIENRWEALPDPPVLLNQGGITSVFDKKILVGVCEESGEFYGYDTITNSWSLLLSSRTSRIHRNPGLSGKAVWVHNTLYFFNQSRLSLDAFDLDRRVWFVGYFELLNLDGLVAHQYPIVYFFHRLVGGGGGGDDDDENLCVLWDNHRLDRESGLKCINFIKFRVTKRIVGEGEGVLDMHIQSSQMYLMDSRLTLQDVFVST